MCWNNDRAFYSMECHYNHDIFGCVGLRHKQHCILNRQYSPEEYEKTVAAIVSTLVAEGRWGEYLPEELSYFGYNETIAQEYFPLLEDEAARLGFRWSMEEEKKVRPQGPSMVPETIEQTTSKIVENPLWCEATGRSYKVMSAELAIHQKLGIPLARLCPDERHRRRLARRPPLSLWERQCAKTRERIFSSHPPTVSWPVYSQESFRDYLYR